MVRSLSGDAFEKMVPAVAYSTMAEFAGAIILGVICTLILVASLYEMKKLDDNYNLIGVFEFPLIIAAVVAGAGVIISFIYTICLLPYVWLAIYNTETLTAIRLMEKF